MDKKNNSIRLVKTGGRKVTRNTNEYNRVVSDRNNENRGAQKRTMSSLEQKVRYQKRQKQRRLKRQRIRVLTGMIITVLLVSILLFMTPVFNIRSVTVDGNNIVPAEEFQGKLKSMIGENLFRTGSASVRKTLKTIPYINTVEVQKKLFPPSVMITVTEYTAAAVMRATDKNLLVNNQLRVLEESADMRSGLPVITGVSVKECEAGKVVESDETDKISTAAIIVSTIEATGLTNAISEIDINNLTNITLNYDNRIIVQCGSQLNIERKIRLLRETVMSNSLAENARGTINLSETGKAIYTP